MLCIQRPPEARVEELVSLTNNTQTFETAEVTASVAVLVTATEDVAGNRTVYKEYILYMVIIFVHS